MENISRVEPYRMPAADDLPPNVAQWAADPGRAVLLIHDMQRYFLKPFAAAQSLAGELIGNAVALRERCTEVGIPVAYTAQPGGMTERQRGLLKDFWGPGMSVDPADKSIIGPLAPADGDWVFTKWRYSAFFGSQLLTRMREHGRDQLIVCGVYAHVGVLMTAVEAFTHDIQTFLAADAVADFSADYHRLAVNYAATRCGVAVTTQTILAQLGTPSGRPQGRSVHD